MRISSPHELEASRDRLLAARPQGRRWITVSTNATCCLLQGAKDVVSAFREELARAGLQDAVSLRLTGCLGFCEIEPMVILEDSLTLYQKVKPEDVAEIVKESLLAEGVVERLLYRDPATKKTVRRVVDVPFYAKQNRLVLQLNGQIEPTSIDDYIAAGGYEALARALFDFTPQEIVQTVKDAGVRGRGGGGFPTGRKWESARDAECHDGLRYVICNADEGDPGAYMDRSVLEGDPHVVIEGMIIGARAVGSSQGYIYVRAEYPLAVEHVNLALRQAEERGLLGDDILGSGHSFRIKVVRGAGAFVCGESTALMASIEGKVGRPRAKYVHTVEKGLRDHPTVLNNVETWANVTRLFTIGKDAYTAIGTKGSPGTKIFSLVGKIHNTGLVEVPMGISLREIIYDIGGGVPRDKKLKAVQTGGPSGGCIPESMLDIAVDFDELTKVGSMMGSGGMIVMDEDTCMVDVARYFLEFLKGESCGKCVPCREGVKRMWEILERIASGGGRSEDLDTLEEMGAYLQDSALCALGSSAANPVLTTLKYFREEYLTHIEESFCPSGVCKKLYQLWIAEDTCTGCMACAKKCPVQAISGERKKLHVIDQATCIKCGECVRACRFDAIHPARVREVVA